MRFGLSAVEFAQYFRQGDSLSGLAVLFRVLNRALTGCVHSEFLYSDQITPDQAAVQPTPEKIGGNSVGHTLLPPLRRPPPPPQQPQQPFLPLSSGSGFLESSRQRPCRRCKGFLLCPVFSVNRDYRGNLRLLASVPTAHRISQPHSQLMRRCCVFYEHEPR
jgi:hypothetical protein